MRHLITPMNLSVEETMNILDLAERISIGPQLYKHVADGRQLATLFYEPSTRTRLSFESAMLSLGGQTLGFSSAAQSSASKGETVADTVRVVSCYADIIAMRLVSMYAGQPMRGAGIPYSPISISSSEEMMKKVIVCDARSQRGSAILRPLAAASRSTGRISHSLPMGQ